MHKKIFLVAGGTGGHLFPAISLAEVNSNNDYYFLLDKRTELIGKKKKLKYFLIQSSKVRLDLLLPIAFLKIFFGFIQSIIILLKYKPELVIGFGGYTSIPSIFAAKILNIKIIIHEQNAIMGRTNRLLSNFTNNIALTFKNTLYAKKSAVHTGIPIRQKKDYKIQKNKLKKILVVGGSQGAKIFGEIIPNIISQLNKRVKSKIFVIQQVRSNDHKQIEDHYKKMKVKYTLNEFFDDIYKEYNNADIVISRCGASTLAEIDSFKKFSILFPLPSAINNHQYLNAIEFKKSNECIIVNENNLDILSISKKIEKRIFLNKKSYKLKSNKKNQLKLSLSLFVNKILIKDV